MIFIYAKEFTHLEHQTLLGIFPTAEDYIACKDALECRCNDLDCYLHQEHHSIEPGKNKNLLDDDDFSELSQDFHFALFDICQIRDSAVGLSKDDDGKQFVDCEGQRKISPSLIARIMEQADKKYNITGYYKDQQKPAIESTDYCYGFDGQTLEALENFISKYKRG
jgi:hypothetical protein